MKIEKIGDYRTIIKNDESIYNYFAWPTAVKTKDGRVAVACSGYRLKHVCPFGKAIIAFSSDRGETYTKPVAVIDTILDDRDAGLCPFGESGLILTSFNNSVAFQRQRGNGEDPLCKDYLDSIDPEEEKKTIASEFRISNDNGKTWSEIYHSPVTSPHGPIELKNGKILWVGSAYRENNDVFPLEDGLPQIRICEITKDGKTKHVGYIDDIVKNGELIPSWEPDMFELPDGKLICHIRLGKPYFTMYQAESYDEGKTWTKPHQILADKGGAPASFMMHSSGTLMCFYSFRQENQQGIRMMFSNDGGNTWDTDHVLCDIPITWDVGYPSTVEFDDGELLTVFYAHEKIDGPAVIMQQKWRFIK